MKDLLHFFQCGISQSGLPYETDVDLLVLVTPARAFINNVKMQSGYFRYDIYSQEGSNVDV